MKVEPIGPIDRCPYCGSDEGYYTKDYVCGPSYYHYNFDGSEAHNESMYDLTSHKRGKYAYCTNCDKRLFKIGKREESDHGTGPLT